MGHFKLGFKLLGIGAAFAIPVAMVTEVATNSDNVKAISVTDAEFVLAQNAATYATNKLTVDKAATGNTNLTVNFTVGDVVSPVTASPYDYPETLRWEEDGVDDDGKTKYKDNVVIGYTQTVVSRFSNNTQFDMDKYAEGEVFPLTGATTDNATYYQTDLDGKVLDTDPAVKDGGLLGFTSKVVDAISITKNANGDTLINVTFTYTYDGLIAGTKVELSVSPADSKKYTFVRNESFNDTYTIT